MPMKPRTKFYPILLPAVKRDAPGEREIRRREEIRQEERQKEGMEPCLVK